MSLSSVVWVSPQGDLIFSMLYENVNSVGQVCRFGTPLEYMRDFGPVDPPKRGR